MVTTTGGLIAAGIEGAVGSIVGLATGGWGAVATLPFGAAGIVRKRSIWVSKFESKS